MCTAQASFARGRYFPSLKPSASAVPQELYQSHSKGLPVLDKGSSQRSLTHRSWRPEVISSLHRHRTPLSVFLILSFLEALPS